MPQVLYTMISSLLRQPEVFVSTPGIGATGFAFAWNFMDFIWAVKFVHPLEPSHKQTKFVLGIETVDKMLAALKKHNDRRSKVPFRWISNSELKQKAKTTRTSFDTLIVYYVYH